jgi:hypothetical protein
MLMVTHPAIASTMAPAENIKKRLGLTNIGRRYLTMGLTFCCVIRFNRFTSSVQLTQRL